MGNEFIEFYDEPQMIPNQFQNSATYQIELNESTNKIGN